MKRLGNQLRKLFRRGQRRAQPQIGNGVSDHPSLQFAFNADSVKSVDGALHGQFNGVGVKNFGATFTAGVDGAGVAGYAEVEPGQSVWRRDVARFGERESDLVFDRQPLGFGVEMRDDAGGEILRGLRYIESFPRRDLRQFGQADWTDGVRRPTQGEKN